MKGVLRTRVGYTGGKTKDPTYRSMGDHTETLQIDFDPQKISYEGILKEFWRIHSPCIRSGSRQYMPAVFYHNEEQKKLATESKARVAAEKKREVHTPILPLEKFYPAEDYHQKYYLRKRKELMKVFNELYPDPKDFMNSTAAARMNAYLARHGSVKSMKDEVDSYGFSEEAKKKFLGLLDELERSSTDGKGR